MIVVGVKFRSNPATGYGHKITTSEWSEEVYHYFSPYDMAVDDFCVVESPYQGYVVTKVVEVKPWAPTATKRVVCPVDDKAYKADLENVVRRHAILGQLDAIKRKVEETNKYNALAEHSPEAKALLEELERIGGGT